MYTLVLTEIPTLNVVKFYTTKYGDNVTYLSCIQKFSSIIGSKYHSVSKKNIIINLGKLKNGFYGSYFPLLTYIYLLRASSTF